MRSVVTLFLFLVPALSETRSTCDAPLQLDFQPERELRIRARSGDVDVIGTNTSKIKITCELRKQPEKARDIELTFREAATSDLRIHGGPSDDVRIRIEIPNRTHLWVRVPAGDLTITGVAGNKDVELHAGDLKISVGDASHYRHVDGSVWAGDLTASAFGVSKGGLFRSFKKTGLPGQYRLHAHVGAGDLVLH
jgi:hypothetical protein